MTDRHPSVDHAAATPAARLLAIVGMPGAGKSLLAEHLEAQGYPKLRFGQITMDELARRGWAVTPDNEKIVREEIRQYEGMDAFAARLLPRIKDALASHPSVILDGLYSFSEYRTLKREFGDQLVIVAVVCDRQLRHARLGAREVRPLTPQEAQQRDTLEIENLEKGGPIAIADYFIDNNGTPEETLAAFARLLERIGLQT
ncbi:MAG: AAA family ATPase [Anaerolineae bacterium]|nr:AAA family ATPase [Anaerolineae bacterium]